MDDAILVEAQWDTDGGRCPALSQALASNHHQAMGERVIRDESMLSYKKEADWVPPAGITEF